MASAAFLRHQPSVHSSNIIIKTRTTRRISSPLKLEIRAAAAGNTEKMATEKMGIKIEKDPDESKLTSLGVRTWPKWGCPPSKFPWTYDSKETCYLLKGKVKFIPDGCNDFVEFGAGDLVEFPQGMKCTWDVTETLDKHYKFE